MDGKTKRYKHGDYRAYKFWTDDQWNGLSENDKAQWTEYSDEEPAAIPKEVIEFTKDNNLETKESCCKEVDECVELRAKVAELEAEINTLKQEDGSKKTTDDPPDPPDEETRKEAAKARLTELGVPFRANTGLPKLLIKLEEAENANNTE